MRFIIVLFIFITCSVNGQSKYNKWSFDGNLGFSNATGPFAEGYSSNYLTFAHLDGGVRHMFTDKVGVKLDFGFDRIKNDEFGFKKGPNPDNAQIPSLEFETHYFRTDLQVVLNLGRVVELENVSMRLSCLVHFGFGFSSLKDKKNSVWFQPWRTQGTDEMMNFMFGITPQYMVNNKLAFHLDISSVSNSWQTKTWDFTENFYGKGNQGKLFNFSLGMSYYFGKADKHLDWVYEDGGVMRKDSMKIVETVRRTTTIRVENHEDVDLNPDLKDKPEDDFDGDGIPNSKDACPTLPGASPNGCPPNDMDGDLVKDSEDACPDVPGIARNNGCPEIPLETKKIFYQASAGVKFVENKAEMVSGIEEKLDLVVSAMNANPEYFLDLIGHTDNLGEKEALRTLSLQRSETVKAYLVSKGIEANRIRTIGLGDSSPLAPNDNPQGREQNRRVEFKIKFI